MRSVRRSLLRNCCIEHLAGLEVEEAEAELVRALAQTAKGAGAMELFVGERAGVAVDEVAAEDAVYEDSERASGGGDQLGVADAIGEATVVGAEGGRCAAEADGTAAQDGRGAVGRGRGVGAEESAARDLVVRGEGEPGGEMLLAAPAVHVRADLADELQRCGGADGIDLSEVGAGQAEEGRADLKARVVVPGFARAPWGGERVRRG